MKRDLHAAIRNQPPVEHEYDWAPIHMPGSVQSYGVLLVADPRSRRVLFASDNAVEMLGVPMADMLDRSYALLTDSEAERSILKDRIHPGTIVFPNPVRLTIKGRPFDAVFHAQGERHLIELEPAPDGDPSYGDLSMKATAELFDPPSIDALYQRAVAVVREVTGFDRVMLYRFDSRYNGQVIAESGREGIGSFLGLFFPSSDIGARARDLYLQNFTRYIPELGAPTHLLSGVFPGGGQADSGHPVDMSCANLRSVVPCHIEYLRNIGIQASMSFSINVDGRLWGLFACHHYAPRRVSYERRVVCEQAAMMFIFRLATMTSTAARLAQRHAGLEELSRTLTIGAALRHRLARLEQEWQDTGDHATARILLARAVAAVQDETGLLLSDDPAAPAMPDQALTASQKLLLELVEADSAAIVHHGRVTRIGDAPPAMSIYAIASMFGRELPELRMGDPPVYATDSLSAVLPAAADIKDRAAGVMAASISAHAPSYLLWFRREQIVHATWAGNPAAEAMSSGSTGANPRASFEAWKQDIRNLSRPWQIEDVEVADALADVLRSLAAGSGTRDDARRDTPAARPPAAPWVPQAVPHSAPQAMPAALPEPARPGQRQVIRIGTR